MSRYFSQFWQGVDNAPSQQKQWRDLAPLTFRFSDYIAHLIWLILGMSEAEMAAQRFGGGGGGGGGGGVCTIPSIQLVLISTMERWEGGKKKQQLRRVLRQWNELLLSEGLSNQSALIRCNMKLQARVDAAETG